MVDAVLISTPVKSPSIAFLTNSPSGPGSYPCSPTNWVEWGKACSSLPPAWPSKQPRIITTPPSIALCLGKVGALSRFLCCANKTGRLFRSSGCSQDFGFSFGVVTSSGLLVTNKNQTHRPTDPELLSSPIPSPTIVVLDRCTFGSELQHRWRWC